MSPCEIRPGDFNSGSHLPSVPAFVTTECPRSPHSSCHAPTPHSHHTLLPENERTHLILPTFSENPLTRSAMVWNDARPAAGLAATARHVHHAPHSQACKETFFLSLALKRDRQPGVNPPPRWPCREHRTSVQSLHPGEHTCAVRRIARA